MTINVTTQKLWQVLQFAIMLAILGLLLWSKPWDSNSVSSETRRITVSGEAIIEAEPDEFNFSAEFRETGEDKEALKEELTKRTNAAVDRLKEIGIEEKDLKLDASNYEYWYYEEDAKSPMVFNLSISADSKEQAQEVQDYLTSLDLTGRLSPWSTFSEAKQKELEQEATEQATADAKQKAQKQAELLDAKLGDVIEVNQGANYGYPFERYGLDDTVTAEIAEESDGPTIPVLQGEDEYRQTVNVIFELR